MQLELLRLMCTDAEGAEGAEGGAAGGGAAGGAAGGDMGDRDKYGDDGGVSLSAQDAIFGSLLHSESPLPPGVRLTVCGDQDQMIYAWRGGTVDSFALIHEHDPSSNKALHTASNGDGGGGGGGDGGGGGGGGGDSETNGHLLHPGGFGHVRQVALTENFRSSGKVVAAANKVREEGGEEEGRGGEEERRGGKKRKKKREKKVVFCSVFCRVYLCVVCIGVL